MTGMVWAWTDVAPEAATAAVTIVGIGVRTSTFLARDGSMIRNERPARARGSRVASRQQAIDHRRSCAPGDPYRRNGEFDGDVEEEDR